MDNDNDGTLVRYKAKSYGYSDPEIMAILQAAPYYEDMYDYLTDSNGMEYTISETFDYSQTNTSSGSFGFSLKASVTSPVVDASISAGYANEWSKSFTEGLSTQSSYRWTATWTDQVVVKRVPVTSYSYEVQDENGKWSDGKGLVISFASEPSYSKMSVEEYNRFVDYYNQVLEEKSGYSGLDVVGKTKVDALRMVKIEDDYLGNEGNPFGYMHENDYDATKCKLLQATPQSFGTGSGNSGFDWSNETSTGYSESMGHGFSFEAEVLIGFEYQGAGFKAGIDYSIDTMETHETSTTNSTGKGISATVNDIDTKVLAEAKNDVYGVEEAAKGYSFDWQVVKWDSNVPVVGGKAPVFGYLVKNISTPSPKVDKPEGVINMDDDSIKISWADSSLAPIEGRPGTGNSVDKYRIYLRDKDDLGNVVRRRVAEVDGDVTEYEYMNPGNGQTEYVFTITSVNSDGLESVESDKLTVIFGGDGKLIYKITKTGTDGNVDTYTIFYSDGSKSTFTITNGRDGKDAATAADENETGKTDNKDSEKVSAGTGLSAYDIAVKNGFKGTEAEWLESLKPSNTVVGIKIDADNNLVCIMSDGKEVNAGNLSTIDKTETDDTNAEDDKDEDELASPTFSSLKKAAKAFTVNFKKVNGATGYQIRYSLKSSMKSAKKVNVKAGAKSKTKLSVKVKSLKAKTTYYVQVRAYTKDGTKTIYSDWSKKKKVKTK